MSSSSTLKPQVSTLLLLAALATPPAFADTHTWTALSGNWSTPTNWSLPNLPYYDSASLTFSDSAPRTITLDTDATVYSLTLNAPGPNLLTFTQSTNSFTTTYETLASTGQATYLQSGGTHSLYYLYLGYNSGSVGNCSLSNGLLTLNSTGREYIGYSGTGNFTQSSGTNNLSSYLYLGYNSGSVGNYTLSNGLLAVGSEFIASAGTGTFTQSGGTNTMTNLSIGPNGAYRLTGGTLQFTGGLANAGTFVLGGTPSMSAGGFINLGHATLLDLSQVSLTIAANSLLILPAGTSTSSFKSFSNPNGVTAWAGAPIPIPAGTTVAVGTGTCEDLILCAGTLTGTANLNGGIMVQGPSARATLGTFRVDNPSSGITGGLLSVNDAYIGYNATGTFTQSGGSHGVSTLYLGFNPGSVGNYSLSSGTHNVSRALYLGFNPGSVGNYALSNGLLTLTTYNVNGEYIGSSGIGSFTQSGGTHSLFNSNLYLGFNSSSVGNYALSNGLLTVAGTYYGEYIGSSGTGNFIQSGGTHSFSCLKGLSLGASFGSVGNYALSNGLLTVSSNSPEYIGSSGTGSFTQTGGTHSLSNGSLYLGYNSDSVGNYSLSNGLLTVNCYSSYDSEYIGRSGIGSFTQTGGTHSLSTAYPLYLGYNPGSAGNYALSNGLLNVYTIECIGLSGTGSFTQTGGTHNLSTAYPLYLGYNPGSSGSYALSGSGLLTAPSVYLGGSSATSGGTASFYMSGGTATVSSSLQLWNNASRFDLTAGSLTAPTLNVLDGSFSQTGGLLTTSALTQSGGSISLGGTQSLYSFTSLTISAGTTSLAPHGSHLLTTTSLTLTGSGTFDLTDNAFILQSSSPITDYTTLQTLITSARTTSSSTRWSGPGLTSSLATHSGMELFGLALAQASALNLTSFEGQTVNANSLLVKYTYVGDANLDSQITSADYDALDAGYATGSIYPQGDFNYDGQVTLADYALLDHSALSGANPSLGTQMLALHTTRFGPDYPSLVPEPTSLSLLLLTAPLLLSRKYSLTRKTSLKKSQPR